MQKSVERRGFLKWGLGGITGALVLNQAKAAELCALTAKQTSGPFYPESEILPVNDLTRVAGATQPALGQQIYVRGVVRDSSCVPVAGVQVEIWQACASGKYNHSGDPNPAPLDPNYRYWGEAFTDSDGR
jgi:protocatechuate 3,4-dioxygenase beta subunit